jgi:hypothetical protein
MRVYFLADDSHSLRTDKIYIIVSVRMSISFDFQKSWFERQSTAPLLFLIFYYQYVELA